MRPNVPCGTAVYTSDPCLRPSAVVTKNDGIYFFVATSAGRAHSDSVSRSVFQTTGTTTNGEGLKKLRATTCKYQVSPPSTDGYSLGRTPPTFMF